MLFNIDGKQVPQQMVIEVGDTFKKILEEVKPFHFAHYGVFLIILILNLIIWWLQTGKVRDEHTEDISVSQAISIVLDRHPDLRYLIEKRILCKYWGFKFQSSAVIDIVFCRQQGLAHEVLQWFICRMEAWFAADADMISLKTWDQASANLSWRI